jgi:hypothetical protein
LVQEAPRWLAIRSSGHQAAPKKRGVDIGTQIEKSSPRTIQKDFSWYWFYIREKSEALDVLT